MHCAMRMIGKLLGNRYVYFAGDNNAIKTGLSVDFEDSAILVAITIYQFELP